MNIFNPCLSVFSCGKNYFMANKFKIKFIDDNGTFTLENPDKFQRLYFPLMNEAGMISSITPQLKGDIKTGQHSFLTVPVSVEDLYLTKSSRNFWVIVNNKQVWSATGVSSLENKEDDRVSLEAGLLYHKVIRENKKLKIKAEILNFVPASNEHVEIMHVRLTNLSKKEMRLTPFFALPLFCRSADNLRDHRNVTSMLNRIELRKHGVVCKPTMLFNESGHKVNNNYYFVNGYTCNGNTPAGFFPTVYDFIREQGDFERPAAVLENRAPVKNFEQGEENCAGIKFKEIKLKPKKSCDFIIVMGITEKEGEINQWSQKFNTIENVERSLQETKKYWQEYSDRVKFFTADTTFNHWIKWVSIQPLFRKIAGNSFMPDFDYGKGGRGWRDLWQDLLAIILCQPEDARNSLVNNFGGIRIDGSNATVIGKKPGEFIADRNNITRVWMDHGVWPFYTINFYIQQTGDGNILFTKQKYFKDMQAKRAQEKDTLWKEKDGNNVRTQNNDIYEGTILEHILVQHLVQFFNVGEHNNIKLEDADWNDGMDMGHKKGESVAFSAFYAGNLETLASLLETMKAKNNIHDIEVLEELKILLDTMEQPIDYHSVEQKRTLLNKYFDNVKHTITGNKVNLGIDQLIQDLRKKADWIKEHIKNAEWIKNKNNDEWFNGYYNNDGERVEGDHKNGVRMTLTGQVFPVMFGIPDNTQIEKVIKSVMKYLWDKKLNGLRLNTNFKDIQLNLGRAFSFAYGHKENGAFFSHMNIMMANALYKQGYVKEGYKVISSIYHMWGNYDKSKIYPGIPEYFNNQGRGYYHYLTGSASWLILTLLTLVYGIRGEYGDLVIAPKLVKEQFDKKGETWAETNFASKRVRVVYQNHRLLDYPAYKIGNVTMNGQPVK